LQVGYVTGDAEYRPQNRMVTARCLYWTKQTDVSVVFATLKDHLPAAVSAIRLYRVVGGLPDAGVREPAPCGGWRRTLGLYYEDPAIAYDFAVAGSDMPDFEELINRTAAYLKYSGQNLFVYPAVWYHGVIGPSYQPRPGTPHADRYLTGWFHQIRCGRSRLHAGDQPVFDSLDGVGRRGRGVRDKRLPARDLPDGARHGRFPVAGIPPRAARGQSASSGYAGGHP
jgi:hypothetical protein